MIYTKKGLSPIPLLRLLLVSCQESIIVAFEISSQHVNKEMSRSRQEKAIKLEIKVLPPDRHSTMRANNPILLDLLIISWTKRTVAKSLWTSISTNSYCLINKIQRYNPRPQLNRYQTIIHTCLRFENFLHP